MCNFEIAQNNQGNLLKLFANLASLQSTTLTKIDFYTKVLLKILHF